MHTSFKTLKTLNSLGLTEYQARAYTALLTPKVATAEEVSRLSGVPRSKVYQVLMDLQKQGWVKVEKGRPLKFRPKDPRNILATKMDRFAEDLDVTKGELLDLFEKEGAEAEVPARVLQGKRIVLEKEIDIIQGAQSMIELRGALYFPEELEAIIPLLFRLHEKGIKVQVTARARVTVDGKSVDVKEAFETIDCEKEFRETKLLKKLLVDERECLMVFGDLKKDDVDSSTIAGILTGKKEIIAEIVGK
jgi:sugar-specific transcriptional regulator TrmB